MKLNILDLAHKFVQERLKDEREVVGVLLRGSSVIGIRDEFVDLDFDLVVTSRFLEDAQPTSEATCFEGVEACWGYKSLEVIKTELQDWLRDTDLWAYSTAKIMHDPSGKLEALLSRYKQYPESVRLEKMFSYFYHATAASPYNSDRAIHRHDYLTAQLFLANAAELYTALLYLANKSFIPYRKWRIRQLDTLPRKADGYIQKISKVLFGEGSPKKEGLREKQAIIMQMMNEVRAILIQEGVDPRKLADDLWRYELKYLPSI